MAESYAQLVVDEELFLAAMKVLNEQAEKHELLNVVRDFASDEYVAARFSSAVGEEIGHEERHAIEYYVSAVYLVSHHRANIEDLGEIIEEFEGPPLDFIRLAAWAFLTAWNQRYGGTHERLRVPNTSTLIDPNA